MADGAPAQPKIPVSVMTAVEEALEEISTHCKFIILIFLLTSIIGVFNAWHILISNFYAFVPPHWCNVLELDAAGWTPEQIKTVSMDKNSTEESSCYMIGWNYTLFAELGYEKTLVFINNSTSQPDKTPCKQYYYDEKAPFSTVVSEWDLVCDRTVQKSNVQGSIALGKFVGGLLSGFIADMIGRRPIFLGCCLIYFIAGVGAALTDRFWLFLIARFCTGIAGAAGYESGFTLLTEFSGLRYRAALGCMFNMGYPIGHITLPLLSLLILNWRHLQLAISLPIVICILHYWLLPESPRWLIVHGRPDKAWKVIKKISKKHSDQADAIEDVARHTSESLKAVVGPAVQSIDEYIPGFSNEAQAVAQEAQNVIEHEIKTSASEKFVNEMKSIFLLFSTCELCKRITIFIFCFIVASLVYYVLALNAPNFHLNQHAYTFIAGWVGIPGYIFPLFVMMCMGRKGASSLLFLSTGLALIVIGAVPRGQKVVIFILAMIGRFTNVAVFGLITVYCAELFPTSVRNSAIGVSGAMSQMGSLYAPYIVDFLGPYGWYLPSTICGIHTILVSLLILLLPETKGKPFPNTVSDVTKQPDKVSLRNCCKFY